MTTLLHDEQCLFCKIAKKEIPSTIVFENEKVLAFKDIAPVAPIHLLFIHKNHTSHVSDLVENDPCQLSDIFLAIKEYTQKNKIADEGFRVLTNTGVNGGQTVFHTHFHLLGGKKLPM